LNKKYFIKWAAPAREDLNEIIEYIAQTNITYDGRRNIEDVILKKLMMRESEL
jgi:plasmid stabilization system protein ParE